MQQEIPTQPKTKEQIRAEWGAALDAFAEAGENWGRFLDSLREPKPDDFLGAGPGLVHRTRLLNAAARFWAATKAKREAGA